MCSYSNFKSIFTLLGKVQEATIKHVISTCQIFDSTSPFLRLKEALSSLQELFTKGADLELIEFFIELFNLETEELYGYDSKFYKEMSEYFKRSFPSPLSGLLPVKESFLSMIYGPDYLLLANYKKRKLNEVHNGVFLIPACEEEGQDSIVKEIFEENPFKKKYDVELENFQKYLTISHTPSKRVKRMKKAAEESEVDNKIVSFCEVCSQADKPSMKLLDHCESYKSINSTSTSRGIDPLQSAIRGRSLCKSSGELSIDLFEKRDKENMHYQFDMVGYFKFMEALSKNFKENKTKALNLKLERVMPTKKEFLKKKISSKVQLKRFSSVMMSSKRLFSARRIFRFANEIRSFRTSCNSWKKSLTIEEKERIQGRYQDYAISNSSVDLSLSYQCDLSPTWCSRSLSLDSVSFEEAKKTLKLGQLQTRRLRPAVGDA